MIEALSWSSASALGGGVDVDLGFDDRHQAGGQDLLGDLELLIHHRLEAAAGQLDDRAHLGAEDALVDRAGQQVVQAADGLHHLRAVLLGGQALVDLEDRHDPLDVPQVVRGGTALDVAIHGHLEQDRGQDPVAVEARAGDDPGPHLVHEVEHLLVTGVGVLGDAVELQRLGGAAAALVEGGDEAVPGCELVGLFGVHGPSPSLDCMVPATDGRPGGGRQSLDAVGGWVFTQRVEHTFEHSGRRSQLEVGDDGGICPGKAAARPC